MLALTRRVGEEVTLFYEGKVIGTIRITSVYTDKTRLSFDAPKELGVYRTELVKDGLVPKIGVTK